MNVTSAESGSPYALAQHALADLRIAVHEALLAGPAEGMTNAEIGRKLGIYHGHVGHEGHIPRTLLATMEQEGAVEQDTVSKRWRLRSRRVSDSDVSTPSSGQTPE
jgi:hypothetical protein